MSNAFVWLSIVLVSLILGLLSYISVNCKDHKIFGAVFIIMDFIRHAIGYFIAFVIGYYFLKFRWGVIRQGEAFSTSDLILGLVFVVSILGWLPYYVKSTHDKIASLVDKI